MIIRVTAHISDEPGITGNISGDESLGLHVADVSVLDYGGEYTVTPTAETQVLETARRRLLQNVTINPIPSNYGLITWDGATLTVS